MTTQTIMKARIADELARSDLTSQIAYAITDAIGAYEDERWLFNETRAITFSTVAAQQFYDVADSASIPLIRKFDYVHVVISNLSFHCEPMAPETIERLNASGTFTGQPIGYCYYQEQIRLYPVPDQVYSMRVAAVVSTAAPAADAETANPWMTKAERLIRSRAKFELAVHVLRDDDLASTLAQQVLEAEQQLRTKTNRLTQRGSGQITPTQF